MKNLAEVKFSVAAMMAEDLRAVNYAVKHSRHIISRGISAPNETINQESLAAQYNRYEQKGANDSIRVLRF